MPGREEAGEELCLFLLGREGLGDAVLGPEVVSTGRDTHSGQEEG